MDRTDDFFSRGHLRLLNFASWARYAAWITLVVHFLWAIGTYLQEQNYFLYYRDIGDPVLYWDFTDILLQVPSYGFSVLIEVVGVLLRGIVYFLVLKGISMGLNMIVETDINYREQEIETNE